MEGKIHVQAHLWKDEAVVGKALQAALVPFETRGAEMSSTFEINYSKTYCIVLSSPSFSPDPSSSQSFHWNLCGVYIFLKLPGPKWYS